MRLHVDAERCTGHGRCYSLVPELLECDDEGFVTIRGASIELDGTDASLALARKAIAACPEDAISLAD